MELLRTIAVIGGFLFLIAIHEFGHFSAAKLSGVRVTDFFIGFGPKLFSFKRGETTYGVAAIPLGGYVKMSGEGLVDDDEPDNDPRSLQNVSLIKKLFILVMGPATNLIAAFVLIAIVFGFSGVNVVTTTVGNTIKGMPAAGKLKPGDKIVAINGKKIKKWETLSENIRKHPNQSINLTVKRKSKTLSISLKTIVKDKKAMIGIRPFAKKVRNLTVAESVKGSAKFMYFAIATTNGVIIKAITGEPAVLVKDSASVVGIVAMGSTFSKTVLDFLYFIGIISLAVGHLNLLPIPPLDGGHIFISIIEKIKGSPFKKNTLTAILATGLALLLMLMAYVIVKDIYKLATGTFF